MTAPTIAHQDWCRWWNHGDLCSCGAIESQPVPVEPKTVAYCVSRLPVAPGQIIRYLKNEAERIKEQSGNEKTIITELIDRNDYNHLQSALKLAQEERDELRALNLAKELADKDREGLFAVGKELIAREKRAKKAEAELKLAQLEANKNPCSCVADGDNGSVAHLCQWHKNQFGKAYKMQNMADSVTVENFTKLSTDKLRLFIAHGIQESTVRKKAEATNRRIVELMKEPSEGMWDGLPRKMILAWDFDAKTPRKFFEFLEKSGCEIPQWLRDEPEMKNLDHVPSKGTRAVILFKAMSAELLKEATK